MTDRPIIYSTPMVLGLLEDRKTMTRRYAHRHDVVCDPENGHFSHNEYPPSPWQKVKPGDRLWVREALQRFNRVPPTAQYVADITGVVAPPGVPRHPNGAALWWAKHPKLPSIHMPRWASRLTLIVTATKIEPLREISDEDAKLEGIVEDDGSEPDIWYVPGAAEAGRNIQQASSPARVFRSLWENLHGEESWNDAEVVAVTFTVHKANIDAMKEAA